MVTRDALGNYSNIGAAQPQGTQTPPQTQPQTQTQQEARPAQQQAQQEQEADAAAVAFENPDAEATFASIMAEAPRR